jgi:GntR family transcriptional regulator
MFQLDIKSRKSIYQQIVEKFSELILSGAMPAGEKLPSVRDLSGMLTVNPNTIQKAYRELERQGYIYTTPGRGAFVEGPESRKPDEALRAEAMEIVRRGVRQLYYAGMSRKEIEAFVSGLPELGQT